MCPDANTLTAFVELISIGLHFVYHSGHCWSARRYQDRPKRKHWVWKAKYFLHVVTMMSSAHLLSWHAQISQCCSSDLIRIGVASNAAAHLDCMLGALGRGSDSVCVNSITSTRSLPHMRKEILPLETGCNRAIVHLNLYVISVHLYLYVRQTSYTWAGSLQSFSHCTSRVISLIAILRSLRWALLIHKHVVVS